MNIHQCCFCCIYTASSFHVDEHAVISLSPVPCSPLHCHGTMQKMVFFKCLNVCFIQGPAVPALYSVNKVQLRIIWLVSVCLLTCSFTYLFHEISTCMHSYNEERPLMVFFWYIFCCCYWQHLKWNCHMFSFPKLPHIKMLWRANTDNNVYLLKCLTSKAI